MENPKSDPRLDDRLLSYPSYLRQPSFVAHHEEGGRVVAAYEIVEVERLPDDEAGAVEGVAGLERRRGCKRCQ